MRFQTIKMLNRIDNRQSTPTASNSSKLATKVFESYKSVMCEYFLMMTNLRSSKTLHTIVFIIIIATFSLTSSSSSSTTTTNSVTSSPIQRSVRLPNNTYPLHYYWHLHTNIHEGNLTYRGNITIDIAVRTNTNEVVLHARRLQNYLITVYDPQTEIVYDNVEYHVEESHGFLIVNGPSSHKGDDDDDVGTEEPFFQNNRHYRLQILYDAVMNENSFGIYWIAYEQPTESSLIQYQAATQFEPTHARFALPCYDEPAFKAKLDLRITHGKGYHAIGNMPVLRQEQDLTTNLTTSIFETTPPISTYLLAFVVSNFESISDEYRGIVQRVFTPPHSRQKGESQLKIAIQAVATFEDYLGVNYPLPKLDHITLNKSYGAAMENWGLITYREDYFLYEEGKRSARQIIGDFITQTHEIAHQWFGNLVSPEWWTFAWLNEGFATYYSHIITDLMYPELEVMNYFVLTNIYQAFTFTDLNVRSHPMTLYVEEESEIEGIFDSISYHKAASVIHMFHHAFQPKLFVEGLNRFLNKYQYSVANEMDLFDCLQKVLEEKGVAPKNARGVAEIMTSWTHNQGIPILYVQRQYNDTNGTGTLILRQRPKNPEDHSEYFWIPINYLTGGSQRDFDETKAEYFMPPVPEVHLDLQLNVEDWLIVNNQQTGFYHVFYDDENLMRIAKALQRDHLAIHELNRAALFRDLEVRLQHSEIDRIEVVFELLKYLHSERNVMVWKVAPAIFEFLERNLQSSSFHDLYKAFVRHSLGPIYRQLFPGPEAKSQNTVNEILVQNEVLSVACSADLPECLDYTHRLAHDFLLRNNSDSLAEISDVQLLMYDILCAGMRYLNEEEFQVVATVLGNHSKSTQYYEDIVYALRCTQNETHIYRYLELLVEEESDNTTSSSHQVSFFMHMFFIYKLSTTARPIIWRFIEQHYGTLSKAHFFVEMFNRLAEYVSNQQLDLFRELHAKISIELQKQMSNSTVTLIAIDSPQVGIKIQRIENFMNRFGTTIHEWLLRNQQQQQQVLSEMEVDVIAKAKAKELESQPEISNYGVSNSLSLQSSAVPIVSSAAHIVHRMLRHSRNVHEASSKHEMDEADDLH